MGRSPAEPLTARSGTTTLPNVTLTAGTQYSYLLLATSGSGTFTFTLTGPGAISFAGPPETPIHPFANLIVMIAALGILVLLKRRASPA